MEEVGAGVSDFSTGDEVFGRGSGTYAEYAVAPVTTLAPKPAAVSFDQAATLAIGGVTAWASLFEAAKLEPGQRLLVHGGAGGVGSFAVQLGHWKGAHVIATASEGNLELVRGSGLTRSSTTPRCTLRTTSGISMLSSTPSAATSPTGHGACCGRVGCWS